MGFLPVSLAEMKKRGWTQLDVVIVTGDAYVDHPSFGAAAIGRILEKHDYRVGIIAMPDPGTAESIKVLGQPRLFFAVASGNIDSMVANYTAFKRKRSDDPYSPGGELSKRPDRAVIVYCNLIKRVYKTTPIVIGGIEASLRRIAHYDFWSNRVRRSILKDSRADILTYGMAEKQIIEIADRIKAGDPYTNIRGTVVISREAPAKAKILPAEEGALKSKQEFIRLYRSFYKNLNQIMIQTSGKGYLVHNPPMDYNTRDLDQYFNLPYKREPHPGYKTKVPAFEMIKDSIISHRGCISGCSFCTLTLHQGKKIVNRSFASILKEAHLISTTRDFKGYVTDIGGATANNYGMGCKINWICAKESCTNPDLCPNLKLNTGLWLKLLAEVSRIPGIKKVSVGSGIRYDLFMRSKNAKAQLRKLINSHISGQLKIGVEHSSTVVLKAMRKTPLYDLKEFYNIFTSLNRELGKKQYLLPYLMSCHPGSDIKATKKMKQNAKAIFGFTPRQVQAFIPLPMTLSAVIFHTGQDPLTQETFRVNNDLKKRKKEHQIFFSSD